MSHRSKPSLKSEQEFRSVAAPSSRFAQYYDLVDDDMRQQEIKHANAQKAKQLLKQSTPVPQDARKIAPVANKIEKKPTTAPFVKTAAKKTKSRGARAEEASAQLPLNIMASKLSFPIASSSSSSSTPVSTKSTSSKPAAGSASDWYEQLMGKMDTTSTTASQTNIDEAYTSTSTPILLSERPDIWDAAEDSRQRKKKQQRMLSNLDPDQRKLDQKLAKIESEDVDKDDFLANLMKNRTGDAFDDLIHTLPQQPKKKVNPPATTRTTVSAPSETISIIKSNKSSTISALGIAPSIMKKKNKTIPADDSEDEEITPIVEKSSKVNTNKGLVVKSTIKVTKKAKVNSSEAEKAKEFVQLDSLSKKVPKSTVSQLPPPPMPPQGPPKPKGWTPEKGRYFSDVSKIGTSKSFDNFSKSCPDWYIEPKYQLEVKRMIDDFNKKKVYTGSPLAQWVITGVNDPDTLRMQYEYENYTTEQLQLKQVEKEETQNETKKQAKNLTKQSLLLLKQPDLSHLSKKQQKLFDQLDMADNDSDVDYVKVDYSDIESDQVFETTEEEEEEEEEDQEENDDEYDNVAVCDDSDDYTDSIRPKNELDQSDEEEIEGIHATPAMVSHQILFLPTQDHRLAALQEYYNNLTAKESSCRLKTRVVIVVRDGRVANQMICKIGLKITKHKKNNKGRSNAGLIVETKGIEMIHERLNEGQRAKALRKFASGAATTMIVTDEFLSMLWPHRHLIGCMIHYDIPLSEEALNGDKKKQGGNPNANIIVSKEEVNDKKAQDEKFIAYHTATKMDERLSFVQRYETHFPDNYFDITNTDSFARIDGKIVKQKTKTDKQPKENMLPFKNTSLVFLATNIRGSRSYAKNMHELYANQYNAPKTAEALRKYAISKY